MNAIDAHNHVIPVAALELFAQDPNTWGVEVTHGSEDRVIRHREGYVYAAPEEFSDPELKLRSLAGCRIDGAVVCVAPPIFFYDRPPERTAELHRVVNEGLHAFCQAAPDRLRALATVPLQDIDRAIDELDYAVMQLGMRGVEVGTSVNGRRLDEPEFRPFLEAVERLDVVLMVHPAYVGATQGLDRFYMTNTVGNPLETAVVAARFICGGVLDRHPSLQVLLVHGGGYLPYQTGRLDRAARVRPEIQTLQAAPHDYLRRFLFDTITFDPQALSFLLDRVGADRVVLGSDSPFDMRDPDPLSTLESATCDETTRRQVALSTSRQAFRWDAVHAEAPGVATKM
jgi:aminocarboxymuconate-semialdehyde decarboxylase